MTRLDATLKRAFDLALALPALVVSGPAILALGAAVRATSPGPAFFVQKRLGRGKRPILLYKLRTMRSDAPGTGPAVTAAGDPRVTTLGRLLRATKLDELPQLWNVVRGDMSLVGPRPVVPEELQRYGDDRSFYLQVRPGITGLWQISGRNDVDYGYRVSLDTWYVRNWSLWYDVAILMKTVSVVLGRKGAY